MIKYLACAAVALGLAATVQAAQINGSVGFSGTYTQGDGTAGDLTTSTMLFVTSHNIITTSGDLSGGTIVSFPGLIFANSGIAANSPNFGSTGTSMFALLVGSTTYAFNITSEAETLSSAKQINLTGNGTFSDGNPLDNTSGTWQLGFGVSGASFTFQSTAATGVPDGGMTVMLLGAALSGLALIRRKLA